MTRDAGYIPASARATYPLRAGNSVRPHIGRDTSDLDDHAALRLYREVAHANLDRRAAWQPKEGLAYALDLESYGT